MLTLMITITMKIWGLHIVLKEKGLPQAYIDSTNEKNHQLKTTKKLLGNPGHKNGGVASASHFGISACEPNR